MPRFIVYPRRGERLAQSDKELVSKADGIQIIDTFKDRILLIESDGDTVEKLRQSFPEWTIEPEIEYQRPETDPLV